MKLREALSYDDVLLVPQQTEVKSRFDCDTRSQLFVSGKQSFPLNPLIASPMSTVCDVDMCLELDRFGCLGILHRGHPYTNISKKLEAVAAIKNKDSQIKTFGVAIGCQDRDFDEALKLADSGVVIICVDVANGHNKIVIDFVKRLKKALQNVHIMAGNVATDIGFAQLAFAGADSVRVGIAGGSVCSTAVQTSCGMPTLQSVLDCAEWRDKNYMSGVSIIADGGAKSSGDIAKAVAARADFVMCGSLLAGTSKSPGKVMWYNKLTNTTTDDTSIYNGNKNIIASDSWIRVKKYEGMASFNVQIEQGRDETKIVPEGVSTYVKYVGETSEIVKLLLGGLRSAMSYSNATTLEQFRLNAEFVKITNNGLVESKPHAIYRL